ncbi:MAG: serine/threonine-protein phosphatase [Opitutaceae bacterium]|nr:serine/threonine-protein phosphatase [Cephaloticoccus sp.]MCP5531012.1 serine/threonine-protein phosphatase [Opitutaceae bacterium]
MSEDTKKAATVGLQWTALSDLGCRRKNNEDAWGAWSLGEVLARMPAEPQIWPEHGCLLIVSDGMGGAKAGEIASEFCVTQLPRSIHQRRQAADRGTVMRDALKETHEALVRQAAADPLKEGMGATLSALWVLADGTAVLGHVGDSRIYRRAGGKWVQLTADQSVGAGLVRRGEMSEKEVSRLRYRAMLEQVMGGEGGPLDPQVNVEPWEAGQDFLFCSDGLHGPLEAEIPDVYEKALCKATLADGAEWLVAQANAAGGPDNITVLLARFMPKSDG